MLFGSRVRPAVIAGLGVITLQQITGQPSVLYYASTIFEEAGVYVSATIAVAVFKLLCTLVSAYYVDRYWTISNERKIRRLLCFVPSSFSVARYSSFHVTTNREHK